jgi:hypothetical protein
MSLRLTRTRAIALVVVVASAIGAMSPSPAQARKTTTKKGRIVTYTSTFPRVKSGEPGTAMATFATFVEVLPGYVERPADFLPTDRPKITTSESSSVGGVTSVVVRGFWSDSPTASDPPVSFTITDPAGRRAYLLLTGPADEATIHELCIVACNGRLVSDVFAEGSDRRHPKIVGPDFSFFLRATYPLGRYSLAATSTGGLRADKSLTVVAPQSPTGLHFMVLTARSTASGVEGETVRITWAGYAPGTPIGLLIYRSIPTAPPKLYEYEFFARFAPIPTDENGSLEMNIATDDAPPGRYCLVTDGTTFSDCPNYAVLTL